MKTYVVDAFTDAVFSGNPAAVCVRDSWLTTELMEKIAIENNLSETAFAVKEGEDYALRWFTPGGEIDLCGHATLATAFVICEKYAPEAKVLRFSTKSGILTVKRTNGLFEMDFPNWNPERVAISPEMSEAIGTTVLEAWLNNDLALIVDSEKTVRELAPDFSRVAAISEGLGVIVTAPGDECDFVSRCFYPKLGVNEDPVTGRAHCVTTPLWAKKLNKSELRARQLSKRGGKLLCAVNGERVSISGGAVLYSECEVFI